MTLVLFLVGLALLALGAEVLIRGASQLALAMGVSPLVVGLTVVAYATGAPELAVSVSASAGGNAGIAVGNVLGSNIFNTLFILGMSAAIVPLTVSRRLVQIDVPIMLAVSLLALVFARDGRIGIAEGLFLLLCGVVYTVAMVIMARAENRRIVVAGVPGVDGIPRTLPMSALSIVLVVVGLLMLILGSRWLVNGAVVFARYFGLSETVIGLTIVAAGTGLPEAATSVVAAMRGQRDIAIGNVVGSNIFNILFALGASATASGGGLPIGSDIIHFDLPVVIGAAIACLPVFFSGYRIARWEGFVFLFYYAFYLWCVVDNATKLQELGVPMKTMVFFVLPLLIIAGASLLSQRRRARERFADRS